jgi:FkbM family methyltransferase
MSFSQKALIRDSEKTIRNLKPLEFNGRRFLDLGACRGYVSTWAKSLGAEVLCVEAEEQNFNLIDHNKIHAAVTADGLPCKLNVSSIPSNHSAFNSVEMANAITVPGISFEVAQNIHQPDIIKMDIEKAEYDCILRSTILPCVQAIGVEFHGMNLSQGLTFYLSVRKLQSLGFENVRAWPNFRNIRGKLNHQYLDFLFVRGAPPNPLPPCVREVAMSIMEKQFANRTGIFRMWQYTDMVIRNRDLL